MAKDYSHKVGTRRVEYLPLDAIKPAKANPKRHADEAIRQSMDRWGYTEPLLLDERTGHLVAGHGRLQSLLDKRESGDSPPEGITADWQVPVTRGWASKNDDEANGYLVADNRLTELGGWDNRELLALLDSLDDLEGVGYTLDEIQELSAKVTELPPTPRTDPDAVPTPPKTPITKLGDVWELGMHRVICGDSTDVTVLDRLMGDESADIVWTDPPYGVDIQERDMAQAAVRGRRKDGKGVLNDDLTGEGFAQFLQDAFVLAQTKTKPGASWYVASPGSVDHRHFLNGLAEIGVARHVIIWVKDRFVMGRADYHYRHEPIIYGWSPGAAHHPVPDRKQDTVWEIPRPGASPEHPTMKPVALIERALENSSNIGAIVLDPFGGSGSTLIAAQGLGRNARLVELDPIYVDVICKRFQEHTGIVPILESTGEPVDFAEPKVANVA